MSRLCSRAGFSCREVPCDAYGAFYVVKAISCGSTSRCSHRASNSSFTAGPVSPLSVCLFLPPNLSQLSQLCHCLCSSLTHSFCISLISLSFLYSFFLAFKRHCSFSRNNHALWEVCSVCQHPHWVNAIMHTQTLFLYFCLCEDTFFNVFESRLTLVLTINPSPTQVICQGCFY